MKSQRQDIKWFLSYGLIVLAHVVEQSVLVAEVVVILDFGVDLDFVAGVHIALVWHFG